MRIRGRSILAALTLMALPFTQGAATAAAVPGASFLVQPGAPCVDLTAIADEDTGVTLSQWRLGADPDSDPPIATVTAPAHLALPVPLCVETVRTADILRLDQGAARRQLSVPDLAVAVDLPNDKVTGIAATTATQPVVAFTRRIGGIVAETEAGSVPYTDGTIFTATPSFDLRRGDRVQVDWNDGASVTVRAVRSTRTVTVRAGRVRVRFTGRAGSLQSATLHARDGTLRATAACRIQDDALPCEATFRRRGDPVTVRAADRVRTPTAKGRVRSTAAAGAVADLSALTLSASCPAKGRWLLVAGGDVLGQGVTPKSGRIRAELADPGAVSGSATLACDDVRGFGQLFRVRLIGAS